MKIKNTNKSKIPKIIPIVIALIVLALITATALYALSQQPPTEDADRSTTTSESRSDESTSKSDISNDSETPKGSASDAPLAPVPGEESSSSITATLTANNSETATGLYRMRFSIGALTPNGTCNITLSKQGNSNVSQSVPTFQSGASTSTCQGFDIPLNSLPAGSWSYDMTVTSGSMIGNDTGEVTVK